MSAYVKKKGPTHFQFRDTTPLLAMKRSLNFTETVATLYLKFCFFSEPSSCECASSLIIAMAISISVRILRILRQNSSCSVKSFSASCWTIIIFQYGWNNNSKLCMTKSTSHSELMFKPSRTFITIENNRSLLKKFFWTWHCTWRISGFLLHHRPSCSKILSSLKYSVSICNCSLTRNSKPNTEEALYSNNGINVS